MQTTTIQITTFTFERLKRHAAGIGFSTVGCVELSDGTVFVPVSLRTADALFGCSLPGETADKLLNRLMTDSDRRKHNANS